VNPPVADQFPITGVQSVNSGVGNDWAVMTTGTNNLGQKPFDRYGQLRPFASTIPVVGNPVDMWGYGVDLTCVKSQTQQLSPGGAVTFVNGNSVQFNADVRGGNSGSGLMRANEILAIVTHCSFGCPNFGTRGDLAAFVSARNALCPCANTCLGDIAPVGGNGQVNVDDLLKVINSWGPCAGCPADLSPAGGNGLVNVDDLLFVINHWGPCP
jgi:hypothetical protein